ncbi:MAG: tetratricopeptide repeat protein [Xanthomonadales bacterium]|nr:tetratricopeptide repeat protein [Xanthomonadales bacterium]
MPGENASTLADERPVLSFESGLFGEPPADIISVADIYQLSEMQQSNFQVYFNHPSRRDVPAHQRVYEYLESTTMNFGYQGDTYAAEEALKKASGNCLSLAVLTTALAQLAGVETGYQLVDSVPVFESRGNVVFRGQHVRTKLYDPLQEDEKGLRLISRGGLLVDYFPRDGDRFVSNISKAEYQAMYYNNLASEAISRKDYNAAFWLLRKVMELTPDSASAINSMAVLHRRAGQVNKAEEIYKYGILYLPDKVSLLRNYRVLLAEQGRYDEAEVIKARLTELDESNPFDWLHAGQEAFDNGDFRDAISFYEKAVEIAPYLHESYAGMAKAHYKLGNRTSAKRELKNAKKFAYQKSIQSLYQAKLIALAGDH